MLSMCLLSTRLLEANQQMCLFADNIRHCRNREHELTRYGFKQRDMNAWVLGSVAEEGKVIYDKNIKAKLKSLDMREDNA